MNEQDKQNLWELIDASPDAIVCSVDDDGFPNAKAMYLRVHEGVRTFWFSTNTSAERTRQMTKSPKACVYFFDPVNIRGLMLTGYMRVHHDQETKSKYWREGDEQYYALGPTDPDYCMMCFTAEKGNFWAPLKQLFDVDSF